MTYLKLHNNKCIVQQTKMKTYIIWVQNTYKQTKSIIIWFVYLLLYNKHYYKENQAII